jgi:hypothetical protein
VLLRFCPGIDETAIQCAEKSIKMIDDGDGMDSLRKLSVRRLEHGWSDGDDGDNDDDDDIGMLKDLDRDIADAKNV